MASSISVPMTSLSQIVSAASTSSSAVTSTTLSVSLRASSRRCPSIPGPPRLMTLLVLILPQRKNGGKSARPMRVKTRNRPLCLQRPLHQTRRSHLVNPSLPLRKLSNFLNSSLVPSPPLEKRNYYWRLMRLSSGMSLFWLVPPTPSPFTYSPPIYIFPLLFRALFTSLHIDSRFMLLSYLPSRVIPKTSSSPAQP